MSAIAGCPRCEQQTLVYGEAGEYAMLACTRCTGVWLDPTTAGRLLSPLSDLRSSQGSPRLPCPSCAHSMTVERSALATVEIDRCLEHGVWFDRDEIAAFARAVARLRGRALAIRATGPRSGTPAPWGLGAGLAIGGAAAALGALSRSLAAPPRDSSTVTDVLLAAPEVGEMGFVAAQGAAELVPSAAEVASGAAEVLGSGLEAAGELLGAILGGLAELF